VNKLKARCSSSALLVSAAIVLAGCSSGQSSSATSDSAHSTGSQAAAETALREASQPLKFIPPGPKFQPNVEADRGKTIALVSTALSYPFSQQLLSGIEQAAGLFGMKVQGYDSGGDPTTAARQIAQAVGSGAAAIVIQSIPTSLLAAPIKSATDHGIPVIQLFETEQGTPTAEQAAAGVFGNVSFCYSCGGALMADFAVAQLGSKVNAVLISSPEIAVVKLEVNGFVDQLKKLCTTCAWRQVQVPVAQWATGVQPAATSAVADPKVNVIAPVFDALDSYVLAGVSAGNATGRVKIVSYNATQTGLVDLRNGGIIGNAGGSQTWAGWAAMDQVLRALSKKPPASDAIVPNRVFTQAMAKSLDLSSKTDLDQWFGNPDYRNGFKALWGLS
jgi:ribose transport system substrate-binding protein